jgi:hypothetical protein
VSHTSGNTYITCMASHHTIIQMISPHWAHHVIKPLGHLVLPVEELGESARGLALDALVEEHVEAEAPDRRLLHRLGRLQASHLQPTKRLVLYRYFGIVHI